MTKSPRDSTQQWRASDPAVSAWVNANAGSGKTTVLVSRVIRLMLAGTEPSKILCLTFTKAAAAEMATRLFGQLSGWIALDDSKLAEALGKLGLAPIDADALCTARRLLTRALETPGGLKIQTIHAFCERLLQLYPVEAGVVPRFQILDERQAAELLARARDEMLVAAMADPGGELGLAADYAVGSLQPDDFDGIVARLIAENRRMQSALDGGRNLELALSAIGDRLDLSAADTSEATLEFLTIDREKYIALAGILSGGSDRDRELSKGLLDLPVGSARNLVDVSAFFLTKEGKPKKHTSLATKPLLKKNPWLADFLAAELARLEHGLGKLADLERREATRALLVAASGVYRRYTAAKRRIAAYDFGDLIALTAALLEHKPDAAWVLYKLDGGIEHVLVDEAQDTSPEQWAIIKALTAEFFAGAGRHGGRPRTMFAVGDRKQSIYSFQGADPDVFEDVHADIRGRADSAGLQFQDVDLSVSFRSTPAVLTAVDQVFKEENGARKSLDGLAFKEWIHESTRADAQGTVEMWDLVKPAEEDEPDPWTAPIDRDPASSPRRRLARQIAGTVRSWLDGRWLHSRERIVEPQDILILVQVRNSFFDALIRELRLEGIPVAGADRLTLKSSLAVQDMLAALRVAVLPEDDYALACLLKSPLIESPLTEEQLFRIAWQRQGKPLLRRLVEHTDPTIAAAASEIARLREAAENAGPHAFLSAVLSRSRKRFAARLGSEASDALDALLDAALDYEARYNTSLSGFLTWFEGGDVEIRRNMEQPSGEVRIMTVHGAKGLEAPIVILPDTVATPEKRGRDQILMVKTGNGEARAPLWLVPGLYLSKSVSDLKKGNRDERLEEYHRQLYVAMTRARDELYVCGYETVRGKAGENCWYKLVCKGLDGHLREEGGVRRMGAAPEYREAVKARHTERPALPDWVLKPPINVQGIAPRVAATALTAASTPQNDRAMARGILVHRILQHLPECPEAERLNMARRMAAAAGFDLGVAELIEPLLTSPEMAAIFGTDGISEVPLVATIPELGETISGRIDRLIVGPEEILVVDYKTDTAWPQHPGQVRPEYLVQLAAYRSALRQIHAHTPVRTALLFTSAPVLMAIPDGLLDRAFDHIALKRP